MTAVYIVVGLVFLLGAGYSLELRSRPRLEQVQAAIVTAAIGAALLVIGVVMFVVKQALA